MFTSGVVSRAKTTDRSDIVSTKALGIVGTMFPLDVNGVEDSWHVPRDPMTLAFFKIAIGHHLLGCLWALVGETSNIREPGDSGIDNSEPDYTPGVDSRIPRRVETASVGNILSRPRKSGGGRWTCLIHPSRCHRDGAFSRWEENFSRPPSSARTTWNI